MIELIETDKGLELRPDDLEALAEARNIIEALESNLANGWETVDPAEIEALTDGTIISQEADRDDHGTLKKIGVVYWDANYAVTDTLDELKAGKTVIWQKGE